MATGTPWSAPSASPDPRARSASVAASRLLTEHGDVGIEPSVALLDSLQKSVHDLNRREVTAPDPCSEFCSRRKTVFFGHALLLLSAPTAPRGVLVSRARGHHRQNLRMATTSISTLVPISSSATFTVLWASRVSKYSP